MLENMILKRVQMQDMDAVLSTPHKGGELGSALIKQLNSIADLLEESKKSIDSPAPILKVSPEGFPESRSYQEFPVSKARKATNVMRAQVDAYKWVAAVFADFAFANFNTSQKHHDAFVKMIKKQGYRTKLEDTPESLSERNPKKKVSKDTADYILGENSMMQFALSKRQKDVRNIDAANAIFKKCNDVADYIEASLDLIEELRKKPEITMDFANKHVIALMQGNVSASSARKQIYNTIQPQPEQPARPKLPIQQIKAKFERTYNKEEVNALCSKGISESAAKRIIDEGQIENALDFITTIETVFSQKGLRREDAWFIFQRNPQVLTLPKKDIHTYTQRVEQLYSTFDPHKTKGILPKFQPQIYKSPESLLSYISTRAGQ